MKGKKKYENLLPQKAESLLKSYKVDARLNQEEVWSKLWATIETQEHKPKRRITWYMAAASIAASLLVFFSLWFFTSVERIHVAAGETSAFRLPDNSRIVLNGGSSISYRKIFWNRNVKLAGEGYFEVEKGEGFLVETELGEVHVLGTRFLVQESHDTFTVQCYEGTVKTSYNESDWILESGTRFKGIADAADKENVNTAGSYPSFALFDKTFKNAELPEVISEVEQFFGVKIQLQDNSGKRFSGSIQTGNLNNVLQIICEPLGLDYSFEDKYNITIH